ncbi:MAG: hypothetical protein ACFB14_21830 [Leptolyngbyaceae cyanobacterium]
MTPKIPPCTHRPRLRHYLVGSPTDTWQAIDRHILGYIERISGVSLYSFLRMDCSSSLPLAMFYDTPSENLPANPNT